MIRRDALLPQLVASNDMSITYPLLRRQPLINRVLIKLFCRYKPIFWHVRTKAFFPPLQPPVFVSRLSFFFAPSVDRVLVFIYSLLLFILDRQSLFIPHDAILHHTSFPFYPLLHRAHGTSTKTCPWKCPCRCTSPCVAYEHSCCTEHFHVGGGHPPKCSGPNHTVDHSSR